jgi:hypothetical protein
MALSGEVDGWIEHIRQCKSLPERELKKLCKLVVSILVEESNVQPVSSPVTVVGDIHGQFYDLLHLFKTGGELPDTNYIFLVSIVVNRERRTSSCSSFLSSSFPSSCLIPPSSDDRETMWIEAITA